MCVSPRTVVCNSGILTAGLSANCARRVDAPDAAAGHVLSKISGWRADPFEGHALSGFKPPRQAGANATARALGRRDWLRAFVGLFGALALGPSLGLHTSWSEEVHPEEWLRRFGAACLGDGAALSRLGTIYLASNPRERNRERLSRLLWGDGTGSVGARLIESISRDWFAHDVTVVDGWVLARTEARLCAALHLMDGARV
jgi:hypothetical protein